MNSTIKLILKNINFFCPILFYSRRISRIPLGNVPILQEPPYDPYYQMGRGGWRGQSGKCQHTEFCPTL